MTHTIKPQGWPGWTDENVQRLKTLAQDFSASEIAKTLGTTRNSVISKCHREDIALRSTAGGTRSAATKAAQAGHPHSIDRAKPISILPRRRASGAERPTPSTPSFAPIHSLAEVKPPTPIRERPFDGVPVALDGLRRCACKWPVGDPMSEGFGYCGAPAPPKRPYCDEHAGIAFSKPKRDDVAKTAAYIHKTDRGGSIYY